MQKNGILSSIADDKHLWESSIDHFKKEYTRLHKKGINKIYTFTGFCNNHDSSIFSKIETEGAIDFQDYESCLLFALRTTYNELWLKEVVIKMQECVINHSGVDTDNQMLRETIRQNELGIKDLEHYTKSMWNDLENKTQSFVFEHREMDYKEICLNAIFTYDTSSEIMDYHKDDTAKVKSYVNLFFKENIKRTHKRLSSLIIFNCETWVCSNTFYKEKFEGLDSEFFKAMKFSAKNGNERKTFNFDLFKTDFKTTFKNFINKNVG